MGSADCRRITLIALLVLMLTAVQAFASGPTSGYEGSWPSSHSYHTVYGPTTTRVYEETRRDKILGIPTPFCSRYEVTETSRKRTDLVITLNHFDTMPYTSYGYVTTVHVEKRERIITKTRRRRVWRYFCDY